MSFTKPPMPTRMGQLANAECDIYTSTASVGDGGIGINTWALVHSGVACSFQEMNSSSALQYGSVSESTLYDLYLPLMRANGTDIEIKGAASVWQFQTDGMRYQAIAAGVKILDGRQRVACKRIGVVA